METTTSFAPLAARLAAQADKIRPADGARNDWAKIVALVWCLVFAMLIALCEALDARAAAVARAVAAPAARDTDGVLPWRRARCMRRCRVPGACFAWFGRTMPPPRPQRETRPWPGQRRRAPRVTFWPGRHPGSRCAGARPASRFSEKRRPCLLGFSTPISLRYSNKNRNGVIGNLCGSATAAKWMAGGYHRAPPGFPGQFVLESGSSETDRAPI